MHVFMIRALLAILLCLGLLASCGDDDGNKTPASPGGETGDAELSDEEAAAVFGDLQESLAPVAGLLLLGSGTDEGDQGTATVADDKLTFENYSPDGELIIDGELAITRGRTTLTLKGTVDLSGTYEGEVEVDLTIGASIPPTYTGTMTLEGVAYDIEALSQQSSG